METVKVCYHIDQDIIYDLMPLGGFSVLWIIFPIYVAADPQDMNYFLFSSGPMPAILIWNILEFERYRTD